MSSDLSETSAKSITDLDKTLEKYFTPEERKCKNDIDNTLNQLVATMKDDFTCKESWWRIWFRMDTTRAWKHYKKSVDIMNDIYNLYKEPGHTPEFTIVMSHTYLEMKDATDTLLEIIKNKRRFGRPREGYMWCCIINCMLVCMLPFYCCARLGGWRSPSEYRQVNLQRDL